MYKPQGSLIGLLKLYLTAYNSATSFYVFSRLIYFHHVTEIFQVFLHFHAFSDLNHRITLADEVINDCSPLHTNLRKETRILV